MKRIRISLILIVIGILICATCLSSVGFDVQKLSTAKPPECVKRSFDGSQVSELAINLSTENITIGVSPDDQAHVTYYYYDNDKHELTLKDGLLSLKRNSGISNWSLKDAFNFNLNFKDYSAEFLLPKDFAGDIRVNASTGDVNVSGLNSLGKLELALSTGEVQMKNVSASSLTLTTSTGSARIEGVRVSGDMLANSTTGECKLEDVSVGGAFTRNCSTGSTSLTRVKCDDLQVTCSTGGIRFKDLDARTLRMVSSTGEIKGSLIGGEAEYSIESHTSTGDNSLPAKWGAGERKLYAKTSTGSIKITFE